MSLFGYFTLSSLYILLNIDIPEKVYDYLEKIYNGGTADLLTQFGVGDIVNRISDEKVLDEKPKSLGISSDLVSKNWKNFTIMIGNAIVVELLIIGTGFFALSRKVSKNLVKYRRDIYMGLLASNTPELVLPWRYVFTGGFYNFSSKVTLAAQALIFFILPFLLVYSLME